MHTYSVSLWFVCESSLCDTCGQLTKFPYNVETRGQREHHRAAESVNFAHSLATPQLSTIRATTNLHFICTMSSSSTPTATPTTLSPAKATWRSKLGTVYDLEEIQTNEKKNLSAISHMLMLPENKLCADCGSPGTVWASVNLGVFLCFRCCSIHRSIGTHISLPKGCTGSDLWGPDEVERMRSIGNRRTKLIYGGDNRRPPQSASTDVWKQFILQKYQHHKFATKYPHSPTAADKSTVKLDESPLLTPPKKTIPKLAFQHHYPSATKDESSLAMEQLLRYSPNSNNKPSLPTHLPVVSPR